MMNEIAITILDGQFSKIRTASTKGGLEWCEGLVMGKLGVLMQLDIITLDEYTDCMRIAREIYNERKMQLAGETA